VYNYSKGMADYSKGTTVYKLSATNVYPVVSPLADTLRRLRVRAAQAHRCERVSGGLNLIPGLPARQPHRKNSGPSRPPPGTPDALGFSVLKSLTVVFRSIVPQWTPSADAVAGHMGFRPLE